MKDIMLDQLEHYSYILFSVEVIEGCKSIKDRERAVKNRFAFHNMNPSLKPQELKILNNAEYKFLLTTEYYKKDEKIHGPFLNTGEFTIKTTDVSITNGDLMLSIDLSASLIYNGTMVGKKVFTDYDFFLQFPKMYETTFPYITEDCNMKMPLNDIKSLAESYTEMHYRHGTTSSDSNGVMHLLLEKQNEFSKNSDFPKHHPITICRAWSNYLRGLKDPMYAVKFTKFISSNMYDQFKDNEAPPAESFFLNREIVKGFKE